MKLLWSTVIIFLCFGICTFAARPNDAVILAFKAKFPAAQSVKWVKESAHEFEASFIINGIKYSSNFNDKGEWLETESPLTYGQLPQVVKDAFIKKHGSKAPALVSKIERARGDILIEIEVKHGLRTIEYFYTEAGLEIQE